MKKIIAITVVVAILIGTFTLSALAFQGGGNGCRGKNSLNLTPDQQLKILQIRQDFVRDTLSLRFDMQKKHLELRQLKKAQTPDQAAINAKAKDFTAVRTQMTTKRQEMFGKIKQVLTPEQLKQVNERVSKRKDGFRGHGRRGGWWGF